MLLRKETNRLKVRVRGFAWAARKKLKTQTTQRTATEDAEDEWQNPQAQKRTADAKKIDGLFATAAPEGVPDTSLRVYGMPLDSTQGRL